MRRVTGSTLGEFVQSEIAEPLGLDGCFIGTPAAEFDRVAARPVLGPEPGLARGVGEGDRSVDPTRRVQSCTYRRRIPAPRRSCGDSDDGVPGGRGAGGERCVHCAVTGAASMRRSGRPTGVDGVRLWSDETRRRATEPQQRRRDLVVPIRMCWRLGYHQPFPSKRTSPSAFGFYGAYGSGGYADPHRQPRRRVRRPARQGTSAHQARAIDQRRRRQPVITHRPVECGSISSMAIEIRRAVWAMLREPP